MVDIMPPTGTSAAQTAGSSSVAGNNAGKRKGHHEFPCEYFRRLLIHGRRWRSGTRDEKGEA